MSEFLALSSAFCFSISHIIIRRGLAHTDAVTGSLISIGLTAVTLWLVALVYLPFEAFRTPVVWYFAVSGIFAPGLGRILVYVGISRIGVARSVPVSSSSPMFASILAVLLIGEQWSLQNIAGTCLVVLGVIIMSRSRTEERTWRKRDIVFPIMAALSFAIAANLRKMGLLIENLPLMASTVNVTTAILFTVGLTLSQKGLQSLGLSGKGFLWFLGAGICNTVGLLLNFYALSIGKLVVIEPLLATAPALSVLLTAVFLRDVESVNLRVVVGVSCTVGGTLLLILL